MMLLELGHEKRMPNPNNDSFYTRDFEEKELYLERKFRHDCVQTELVCLENLHHALQIIESLVGKLCFAVSKLFPLHSEISKDPKATACLSSF